MALFFLHISFQKINNEKAFSWNYGGFNLTHILAVKNKNLI